MLTHFYAQLVFSSGITASFWPLYFLLEDRCQIQDQVLPLANDNLQAPGPSASYRYLLLLALLFEWLIVSIYYKVMENTSVEENKFLGIRLVVAFIHSSL